MERQDKAMFIKSMRKLLRTPVPTDCDCMACETEEIDPPPMAFSLKTVFKWFLSNAALITIISLIVVGMFSCKAVMASTVPQDKYTDQQIANAIRKAEGVWTYGIKTVACNSEIQCRNICLNTIKNNRKRYSAYGYKHYPSFIQFLGSRFCPTTGRNLTASEKRLNKNWVRNVIYFLEISNERA